MFSDVGTLIDFFSFAIWTFYGLTFLSTIVLRWRRPDMERPFKVSKSTEQIGYCRSADVDVRSIWSSRILYKEI